MRAFLAATGLLVCTTLGLPADEPAAPQAFPELAQLLHKAIVKQLPPEVEKRVGWGETIPVPPNLPLPRLRTYVRVGDHYEVPHGPWVRIKGHIEDPPRNLQVQVRDFQAVDATTYRLAVDVDTVVACEGEWQQWQKGLLLIGATALVDAALRVSAVCDVGVSLDVSKFPPGVTVEPKVKELRIDLKGLSWRNRPGEKINGAGERIEEVLREVLKQSEPLLIIYANDAIGRALREGKGTIAPEALLKAAQGAPKMK